MKGSAVPAEFTLEKYKITQFEFAEPGDDQESLSVDFIPSGSFIEKEGKYILILVFVAFYGENKDHQLLKTQIEASFRFKELIEFESLPPYFYKNAIAIVFPYLRAFISTLTSVAMVKPVILPVLNLSNLEEPLKQATTVIKG